MKTQEEVVRQHAVGPISIYKIYQEGYQDRELDDWDAFRMEAAKDILCSLLNAGMLDKWENLARTAIKGTDELIRQLRDGKE